MDEVTTVHVITELGPTDGPGLLVPAQLLGAHVSGHRIFYYDPFDEAMRRPFDASVFDRQSDPCPYPHCISRRGHRGRHPIVRPSQDTPETT